MWERLVTLTTAIGEWILDRLDQFVARASILGNPPVFAQSDFPWSTPLAAEWTTIRRELDAVLAHRAALPNFQDISTDQASITDDDRWKTYFLYGFGFRSDANCARCPETARLVAGVPGMRTAMFSILAPGKHIPDHCGPYKGLIRYHLGLKVPRDATRCRIRIGDRFEGWTEGGSLIFDDTYEHEVWNDTQEERVILLFDFDRPMRFWGRAVNKMFIALMKHTAFYQEPKKNLATFEERFEAATRRAGENLEKLSTHD